MTSDVCRNKPFKSFYIELFTRQKIIAPLFSHCFCCIDNVHCNVNLLILFGRKLKYLLSI